MKAVAVRGMIGGLLVALSFSSCAVTSPRVWYRENTTEAELKRDDFECKRQAALAQTPPGVRTPSSSIHQGNAVLEEMVSDQAKQNLANDCMQTKGYRLVTGAELDRLKAAPTPAR